ncbi:MAG: hypothetical protein ABJG15_17035 [Hyphomonadaceae bacterium]
MDSASAALGSPSTDGEFFDFVSDGQAAPVAAEELAVGFDTEPAAPSVSEPVPEVGEMFVFLAEPEDDFFL